MSTKLEGEAVVGLAPNAMLLPARPSARHHALLSSYLLNLERGPIAVRDMIVTDLSIFLDLGASQRVADLLIVLRLFFAEHPEAGYRRGGSLTFRAKWANEAATYERVEVRRPLDRTFRA